MGGGEMTLPSGLVPPRGAGRNTISVLVTTFGPFPTKEDSNTSHMISKLLPTALNLELAHHTSDEGGLESTRLSTHLDQVRIEILNPTSEKGHEGIPVEYAEVRSYVAELYDQHFGTIAGKLREVNSGSVSDSDLHASKRPIGKNLSSRKKADLIVHLGMADGWDFISVERAAYKQGFSSGWWGPLESRVGYYMIPDNRGHTILNCGPCPWLATPMGLQTSFDVDELVAKANKRRDRDLGTASSHSDKASLSVAHIPIKAHAEPGSYCCGFIYYESLANCWVREKDPDVLFCHVPGYKDAASLQVGRDAIVAIIKEAVMQLIARKKQAEVES